MRNTLTIQKAADGSFEAKWHGMGVVFRGATATDCLASAARTIEFVHGIRDEMQPPTPQETP